MGDRPRIYRALYTYDTGKDGDLRFRPNDIIAVLDDAGGEREAWWSGELEGRRGTFPGTFVAPLEAQLKTFTAPEDQDPRELSPAENEALQRLEVAEKARFAWETRLGESFTEAEAESRSIRKVRFEPQPMLVEVWSPSEYDRKGEFSPEAARAEWDQEEEEEKLRQLEDRWQYFERALAPGQKCQERLHFEELRAEHERRQAEAAEQAKLRRAEHKKKLMEARAGRQKHQQTSEVIGAISQTGQEGASSTDPEKDSSSQRLVQSAELRSAPPPPPPAAVGGPKPPDRAERLRRLAEQRRQRAQGVDEVSVTSSRVESIPHYLSQEPAPSSRSGSPAFAQGEAVSADAMATVLPDASPAASPAVSRRSSETQHDANSVVTAVDQAINQLEQRINTFDPSPNVLLMLRRPRLSGAMGGSLDGFNQEFRALDLEDKQTFTPSLCESALKNPSLNRYHDILPYESHRVILNPNLPNNPDNYINASLIKELLQGSPEYIAAQGPTLGTVEHFWKMVAQYKCRVIVMLTRVREGGRPKCAEYWPADGQVLTFPANNYGSQVTVRSLVEKNAPCWAEREFMVEETFADGSTRVFRCVQMHFLDWPDHGVPDSAASFLSFLHAVMSVHRMAKKESRGVGDAMCPLIIHCSAGVGRSGVFCTVYSALTYLPYLGRGQLSEIDVLNVVRKLRTHRRYMVQTAAQYKFCFYAILHAARLYQDGSRKLRERNQAKGNEAPPQEELPVWVFSDFPAMAATRRLVAADMPGLFLVRPLATDNGKKYCLSVLTEYGVQDYEIQWHDSLKHFTIDSKLLTGCSSLLDVIGYLKAPQGEIPCPLTGFLHRDGVTQEQINRDQARFDQPRIKPVAIKSTETAPAPSPTSPLKKLDRRTSFAFPDKDVTKLSFASKPSGVTVRGRDAYLTFLNGNYVELTQPVCGHIAFRSSQPIPADYGKLAGQSVYIYFDVKAASWVLYMKGIGVLAAAPCPVESPADCEGQWLVLDHGEGIELLLDPKVNVVAYMPPPAEPVTAPQVERAAVKARPMDKPEETAVQKPVEQLTKDNSTDKPGEKRVASAVKNILAQQLVESQQREQQLMQQLAQLQLAVAEQSDDLMQVQETKLELRISQARCQELQGKVDNLQIENCMLNEKVKRLQESNESLAMAVAQGKQSQQEAAKLQNRMLLLEQVNSSLMANNDRLQAQNTALETQLAASQTHREEARQDINAQQQSSLQQSNYRATLRLSGSSDMMQESDADDMHTQSTMQDAQQADDYFAHRSTSPSPAASEAQERRGLPAGSLWDDFVEGEESSDNESYVALRAFEAQNTDELPLQEGDTVQVTDDSNSEWWKGVAKGQEGRFPAAYVGTKM